MPDIMSSDQRSRLMSRICGKNTTPERYVAVLLDGADLDFLSHDRSLPGCPDFVLPKYRLAIFVDGDFWHGWRFPIWKHKLSLKWQIKISENRRRDASNRRKLRRMGWKVLRIWEHQIEADLFGCLDQIIRSAGTKSLTRTQFADVTATLPPLKRRNRLPKP